MHKLALNLQWVKYPTESMHIAFIFDAEMPLVLTYLDLHPRNIILGDDGKVWIVDGEAAGYYPHWFEYATLRWWTCGMTSCRAGGTGGSLA
ncbi:hypothetical protein C8Q77DRAFT_1146496 [Trametes polyzona]|nr:hypothetical protein C8Q77DRAFT_1146496 [Trametes polyzona]